MGKQVARDRYQFDLLAKKMGNSPMAGVYRKIGERARNDGVYDSPRLIRFTEADAQEFKDAQWDHIHAGEVQDGFQTMEDVRTNLTVKYETLAHSVGRGKLGPQMKGEAIDSFFNDVTGIGTGVDPGSWNASSTPVSISPQEATAYYSNGGIAGGIIDKKFKGIFFNGYGFEGGLEEDDLKKLKEYSEGLNFQETTEDWWRDGGAYGGALIIPDLGDTPVTYLMSERDLAKQGMLNKGCIQRFWEADRWNSVLIPDYDISAADYLTPREFMIPIAGLSVATWRMGIARPKRLPYWGTLRQMGWGISDFVSFMPSLLAYEMGIRSIPIISQQLSLVYLHAPLDAIISTAGLNAAKKIQQDNETAIQGWSMLHPKMLNMFGELKSIERHFTDFDKLILLLKQDVGAKAEISHTVLFNELQGGMDEKSYDITLKQTETIKKSAKTAGDQLQPIVRILVFGCFGYDSPQAKLVDKVRIKFDTPVVPTNEENNETLTAVVNAMAGLRGVGFGLGQAAEIVRTFVPRFELSKEVMAEIKLQDDMETETDDEVDDAAKKAGLFDGWPLFGKKK